jgi:EAL domain-containing protein (putative c-di-GMP-specific phosphodiesterase class I)
MRIFNRLRELGIGLSINDFGTGYSSLRYLERFPLTEIKIDRSFVAGLPHSAAKRVIVEAVIKLGAELSVRVVGEGVERQTERDMLAAMGCSLAQGYLFSAPLPGDEFSTLWAADAVAGFFSPSRRKFTPHISEDIAQSVTLASDPKKISATASNGL